MKPSRLLLGQLLFLCILPVVYLSNPDSEVVQGHSEDDNEPTSTPALDASTSKNDNHQLDVETFPQNNESGNTNNSTQKLAPMRNEPRSIPGFRNTASSRLTLPFQTESRILYVLPSLNRLRDRETLYSSWRNARNNRTNLVVSTDDKAPTGGAGPMSSNGNAFGLPTANPAMRAQGVGNSNVPSGISNPSNPGTFPNRRTSFNPNLNRNVASNGNQPRPPPQNTGSVPHPNNPQSNKNSPDNNLFASIVNDFTFKLMEAANLNSNFVVSPLSIFVALSMCYLGSDGNTKAQMEKALGLNDNAVHGDNLHQGISDLLRLISPDTPEYQLFVANGMFLGKNFTVNDKFAEDMRNYYGTELRNLDFGNPDLSVSVINDWVSRNTRNMIPNIINRPPPMLTRLLLMNAVFFKGTWKTQFPVDLTYQGQFHYLDGNSKNIPTMALFDETFPFYRSEDQRHSFIKLPYAGDQVSMVIALPYAANEEPMPAVRDQILCYVRDAMREIGLNRVAIPKFRMDNAMSLRRPLLQLGISDIFSSRAVDLRKLRQQNDVYVSAILHKAVVTVDEQGTTAAASTGVRFVPLSYRNTTSFVVDHPFAFYIIHEPSGLVLFYGKVYDFGGNSGTGRERRENLRPKVSGSAVPGDSSTVKNPSRIRLHGGVRHEDEV